MQGWVSFKVKAVSALLKCFGHQRAAHRLVTGHEMWDSAMELRNDFALTWSIHNVLALESVGGGLRRGGQC
jgi:hypothetical protein